MILLLGAAGAVLLLQSRPRRGSVVHHQGHGRERRLAGRDRHRDADAGRRQDREEAAGAALSRPRRELFAARRRPSSGCILSDTTPPAKVKDLWYQVRKKVGDIRGDLPAGIIGPNFNDEYGDVYSALYMLTADGLSLAELKTRAEDIRQRLLRVPDVNKVDIIGERPQKIFIEFSHAKLATLGVTPQQIFDSVARQNAVVVRRLGRHLGRPHQSAGDRRVLRRRRDRRRAGAGRRPGVPARRHRDGQARLRGSAELHRPRQAASPRSASASRCRTAPTSSRSART